MFVVIEIKAARNRMLVQQTGFSQNDSGLRFCQHRLILDTQLIDQIGRSRVTVIRCCFNAVRHISKDGRWEGRYTVGYDPATGKPISKNDLAKTQKECKEKLKLAQEEAGKIDFTKSDQHTIGQWTTLWFENYAKPSIRETTAAYYKNYIDKHIIPHIGKIKLNKLTTLDLQKFYNKVKEGGRVQRYEGMQDLRVMSQGC